MGPIDHSSDDSQPRWRPQQAEDALRVLSQDLESLRHNVSTQLTGDIAYLQAHKQRLMADIEALEQDFDSLKGQHRQLQADHAQALSQQQLAQQQLWAKRLAQALATHLQAHLTASLRLTTTTSDSNALSTIAEANQSLAALDATLHTTLRSLQQDLNSYYSTLSTQVNRMQTIEQQGEAILDALVTRLSQQLQQQMVQPSLMPPSVGYDQRANGLPVSTDAGSGGSGDRPNPNAPPAGYPTTDRGIQLPLSSSLQYQPTPSVQSASMPPQGRSTQPPQRSKSNGQVQLGLLLVGLSTLALSFHNVLVGIIGYGGELFGRIPISPTLPLTIPNSLMLLWLRMVVVLPLLALVAAQLYPRVWVDMRQMFHSRDKRPLAQAIASGSFLFLSQVLIYKAISDVGPGVAVTLLFMYPLITVPLAWALFGDRPTPLRLVVMFAISMGIVFTALPRIYSDLSGASISLWGIGSALLASVAFALFLVSMQLCFRRFHPVPVSLTQFCTIFALTSVILIVGSLVGLDVGEPSSRLGLYGGAGLLGLLTLLGYLFNNYGVKLMGAAQASIVAASGPVVTAILAYIIVPGEKSSLLFIQWMGVILVTLGVICLSLERLSTQRRQGPPSMPPTAVPGELP
ncbi:DMT family transporter [Nodosilinea sp. P-1105]|uniref:DMT family transporter n=1 Tax=Nodosilinea sp. P-1105 TaxID=2546229 RepID=UPI00146A5EB7|nr:DMT family transporter [Nodosilinea sp. P-1105]NMF84001.1 DMT family transporter [Nodosilinea sp. P-1105]